MNRNKIMDGNRRNGMGRTVAAAAALLVAGGAGLGGMLSDHGERMAPPAHPESGYASVSLGADGHRWDRHASADHGAARHGLERGAGQGDSAVVAEDRRSVAAAGGTAGGGVQPGIALTGEDIVGGQHVTWLKWLRLYCIAAKAQLPPHVAAWFLLPFCLV